jgi:hypothetical protein
VVIENFYYFLVLNEDTSTSNCDDGTNLLMEVNDGGKYERLSRLE